MPSTVRVAFKSLIEGPDALVSGGPTIESKSILSTQGGPQRRAGGRRESLAFTASGRFLDLGRRPVSLGLPIVFPGPTQYTSPAFFEPRWSCRRAPTQPGQERKSTVKDNRPVNLDIGTMRLPITAWASISHRISGVVLFVASIGMLWALDTSLSSAEGFTRLG
ncbi:MAG TPA: succinate dehydrogenase, cytochrome b556 subunit [Halieaceae bacterium]|nr:succinate dehydrogenase, cytochrome b556 subunit [Halieaceae bacterium]